MGGLPALCTSLSWPTPTLKACTPLLLLELTFEKWRAKHANRFAPAHAQEGPPSQRPPLRSAPYTHILAKDNWQLTCGPPRTW